jgi:hypothetical protein
MKAGAVAMQCGSDLLRLNPRDQFRPFLQAPASASTARRFSTPRFAVFVRHRQASLLTNLIEAASRLSAVTRPTARRPHWNDHFLDLKPPADILSSD